LPRKAVLVLSGRVASIKPSKIPRISIAVIKGDNFNITMDVYDELRTFDAGDKVTITVSKNMPEYEEGRDFCAKGFLMARKKAGEDKSKLLISLWGLLVSMEIPRNMDSFSIMDELYYCVRTAGSSE